MKWLSAVALMCCLLAFMTAETAAGAEGAEGGEGANGNGTLLLPGQLLDAINGQYLTIASENDLYGGGTDKNYTNGLRVTWLDSGRDGKWITGLIDKVLPFFPLGDSTLVSYTLGQNLYTPADIDSAKLDKNDRPWAAFLYSSVTISSLVDTTMDELELTVGVVGPWALGEEAQRRVHRAIGSPQPQGWDNQLHDEVGLNVSWQRRWLGALTAENDSVFLGFTPHVGVAVGNIYSYLSVGGIIKLCPAANRWNDRPLLVRPSMPGTGYFLPTDRLTVDFFIGFEGRYVLRNIFLDGNTFVDSHSVEKKPFVADLSAGVSLSKGRYRLNYTVVHRSKEFYGQQNASIFGSIGLSFNF